MAKQSNPRYTEDKRLRRLKSATGVAYPTGYVFFRGAVLALARLFIKPRIYHQELLPQPNGVKYRPKRYRRNGNDKIDEHVFILAANHGKVWDIPLIGLFRRGLVWICKPAFCKVWWLAMINQRMGAVPIFRPSIDGDRPNTTAEQINQLRAAAYTPDEGLEVALKALARGVPVEMFPEGTRIGRGIVDYSKSGTARLARRSGVPIVPLAIAGCAKDDPVVRRGLLHRRVIVGVVCPPIVPADYLHLGDDQAIDKALMQQWRDQINLGRKQALDILNSR